MLAKISWTSAGLAFQSPPHRKGLPLLAVALEIAFHMGACAFQDPTTSPYTQVISKSPASWVCNSTLTARCGWTIWGEVTLRWPLELSLISI